jgi:hypothetical protein
MRGLLALMMSGVTAGALALQPQIQAGAVPTVDAEAPMSAQEARETALALASLLDENYTDPEIGARYAEALRSRASAGAYDPAKNAMELARLLTADVQVVAPDNHLRVTVRGNGAGPGGPRMVRRVPGAPPTAGMTPVAGPRPVEEAKWLAPGIAYIRFTSFLGDPADVAAIDKFLSDHADAATLIIDIRTHRGGGLAEMDAILPYLYERETKLLQMDTRASVDQRREAPFGEEPRLRRVAGPQGVVRREHYVVPHATEQRLFDAKVYLLTSNFTASAAEHFALALKRTGRATLIGEETAGAGNYGGIRPVGRRFAAFIPVGMTRDPETGSRWEGSGIKPDVPVQAEQALVEALARSGVDRAEAERLSATVHPAGPMRRPKF